MKKRSSSFFSGLFCMSMACGAVEMQQLNSGKLLLEDVPPIPEQIKQDLKRYQNTRSGAFLDWTQSGKQLYIRTRFGNVRQIHRVAFPGAERYQLTFFDEPVGSVQRQPQGELLSFSMDAGGSENAQIFSLDPATGDWKMLSDGESRNGAVTWDRQGKHIAFQSTRRNGKANDIWVMPVAEPDAARLVLQSPDGSWWGAQEFSVDGRKLLLSNYISVAVSRILLLDLQTGVKQVLAGVEKDSVNLPQAFDATDKGIFFITDRNGEFEQLAWQSVENPKQIRFITQDIPWDVDSLVLSPDRSRGVFSVNANGRSELYLLDTTSLSYRKVENLPMGLVSGAMFSPDGKQLAMSLNTPKTPADSFVLSLGEQPLDAGSLERWTFSEVGGLDTADFIEPELIHYPGFDTVNGKPRQIPAWLYKPRGTGPFPVVVSIHGGPEGQARPRFSSTYQMWLNKLGVAIVVPNVRGSSGYGKTWLSLDNGYKREDSVKDIGALLDWIATQKDLDQKRVAVFGGSYGGYMVLASAVHYSDRLKAAVDIVGISNFVTFLENTKDYRRDLRRVEYGDERDPAMRTHLEKISPLNNVEKIAIPLLVVQGQNDPRVPVTEAEQIVKALRTKGQPVWYMNALNEGHGYRKKENRDVYQQVVVMFFRKYLLEEQKDRRRSASSLR
jgi:dipeptidyl aminopeptidase/acylaminoacyl peptidase